jgi:glutathione synthetase
VKFLFILDPLESLKAYKDTSVAMMRAAQARGHQLHYCEQGDLFSKGGVHANAGRLALADNDEDWYRAHDRQRQALASFDAVLMRKDPPFDLEYLTSVWLLSQAEREGARVFNNPAAVRDHNEKLGILEFPQFIAPTLATRDPAAVHAFIDEHRDAILKRLDGMGGESIFRVKADDPNRNVIVETMTSRAAAAAWRSATSPRSRRATSACCSSTARRCRIRLPAWQSRARRAPTSPPAGSASRKHSPRARRRSPRRSGRCSPRAACCWWAST